MPQMANITVKNAGNNDVVLTALTPSSGDRAALWRHDAADPLPLLRPTLKFVTGTTLTGCICRRISTLVAQKANKMVEK